MRRLSLTGFLIFLALGTAVQIPTSKFTSLAAQRMYSSCSPLTSSFNDTFNKVAMWQLFFTMFAALAMKVNMDNKSLQDQSYFDWLLTLIQFVPHLVFGVTG